MSILTADERFVPVNFQKFFNKGNRRIHLALNVRGLVISSVVSHAFIMDRACCVQLPEKLRHLKNIPAAEGFIPTGPYQYAGMILVPLVNGIDPVKHGGQPLRPVTGNNLIYRQLPVQISIPGPV